MGAESAREWHSWVLKASVSGTRGSGKPSDFRHMSSAKRSQPSDLNQVDLASGCIIYIYIYTYVYVLCPCRPCRHARMGSCASSTAAIRGPKGPASSKSGVAARSEVFWIQTENYIHLERGCAPMHTWLGSAVFSDFVGRLLVCVCVVLCVCACVV